jgi:adenylate cyclase
LFFRNEFQLGGARCVLSRTPPFPPLFPGQRAASRPVELKFIGDAMLATISFDERDEKAVCRRALDADVDASANLKIRNLEREAADLPFANVDIALHVGEVLYGNVGAVDRPDFTVIGPAVNEVVRMEKLCEPLGQPVNRSCSHLGLLRLRAL